MREHERELLGPSAVSVSLFIVFFVCLQAVAGQRIGLFLSAFLSWRPVFVK